MTQHQTTAIIVHERRLVRRQRLLQTANELKMNLCKNLKAPRFGPAVALLMCVTFVLACGDDDNADDAGAGAGGPGSSESPSPAPGTPAPPDPTLATNQFFEFVEFVQADDAESAWELYVASVPGDLTQHNAALGCEFGIFASELTAMKHMFDRIAPLTVEETFGAAQGSLQIEIRLMGNDDNEYLATLIREPSDAPYRLRFFNSGRPAAVPGAPDPFPSPEDPRGFCGIWTGPR